MSIHTRHLLRPFQRPAPRGRTRWFAAGAAAAAGLTLAASLLAPATAASSARGATVQPPPTCRSVRAELGRRGAAVGSTYQTIRLRNTSGRTCRIGGFPNVSYVNRHHRLIGWPASPNRQSHHPHRLAPGHAARVVLQIPNPGNFPRIDCLRHNAYQIRVRTRGAAHASYLHWDQVECTTRFGRSHVSPVRR